MKKIFLTMAVMAVFAIGFSASDEEGGSSNQTTEEILKEGYDRGYDDGIKNSVYNESSARIAFTNLYGAPKSDEEIDLLKKYKEEYDKGWEKGHIIKLKMDD